MQQYLHTHVQPEMGHARGQIFSSTPTFLFADTIVCCEAAAVVVCAPFHLAREEGKEESRPEGTDDGELEEEEEERGDDELEDKELSPPDHIAGAPLEQEGHLNTVSVCLRVHM